MIRKKRKKRINRARSHSIGQSKGLGGGSASEAERKVIRMAGMEVSLDVEGGKLREHKPGVTYFLGKMMKEIDYYILLKEGVMTVEFLRKDVPVWNSHYG